MNPEHGVPAYKYRPLMLGPSSTTLIAALLAAVATPAGAQFGTSLELETAWVFDADAAHPGDTVRAAVTIGLPGTYHVQSDQPRDEFLIPTVLTVTPPPGWTVREVAYPEPREFEVQGFAEPLAVFEQEFVIGVAIEVGAGAEAGAYPVTATLSYQACDESFCLAPTELPMATSLRVVPMTVAITSNENPIFQEIEFTGAPAPPVAGPTVTPDPAPFAERCDVVDELANFSVLGTTGGYMGRAAFLEFIDGAETGTLKGNVLEGKGPLAIVLLVIVGGILLNLTPCVLPLIPINLAIIGAGARAGSRARGFALGGTYGLAMALVYGVLGLIVTLTAHTFGAVNSEIWFNLLIAALFVGLALAMFDVIHIDFSKFQSKLDVAGLGKSGSFALAFGMGTVAAFLAGACVAPVVIQVVVYASDQYAKGSSIALALPFCLGLGMALPWPFAGAGLSFLPKPGKWMVRVKQAMGVFILAFACYYGYLAWEIWGSTRVDRAQVRASVEARLEEGGWTGSICGGLAEARARDKLVLIDMWATWCKNCLAMDKTTFAEPAVKARLADYVKIKFQAEDLTASPAAEMLERFEGIGLPVYAILKPGDATDLRASAP